MNETTMEVPRASEQAENFVIRGVDGGYRVCSTRTPTNQYLVTGIPDDPRCNCPGFGSRLHNNGDGPFGCKHIRAVFDGLGLEPPVRHSEPESTTDQPSAVEAGRMIELKRSVSPDGNIDALSIVLRVPVEGASEQANIESARVGILLQNLIAEEFRRIAHGNGGPVANGNSDAGPQPAELIDVGEMDTRNGRRLFINVGLNGRTIKFFGTNKDLAAAVRDAGYPEVADGLRVGDRLGLPCQVRTSRNGRYVNVEEVFPVEAPRR